MKLRSLASRVLSCQTVVPGGWGCLRYTKFETHVGGPGGSCPRGRQMAGCGETGELQQRCGPWARQLGGLGASVPREHRASHVASPAKEPVPSSQALMKPHLKPVLPTQLFLLV